MKSHLKSYVVGFIVPFFDENDPTNTEILASNIADRYCDWFDTLSVKLYTQKLVDQNTIILFDLIVMVDELAADPSKIESDWEKMKAGIKSDMDKFLTSRNLLYKIIE